MDGRTRLPVKPDMQVLDAQATPRTHAFESMPLEDLLTFEGAPQEFWGRFMAAVVGLFGARRAVLMRLSQGQNWQAAVQWPPEAGGPATDPAQALRLATAAMGRGAASESAGYPGSTGGGAALGVRIGSPALSGTPAGEWVGELVAHLAPSDAEAPGESMLVLVLLLEREDQATVTRLLALLKFAAQVPAKAEVHRALARLGGKTERLHDIISLATRLGTEHRFLGAAMALCGELAVRFDCDRVGLGWIQGDSVFLKSISHIEKFDRKMASAQELETVMEEALDQDALVAWPAAHDSTVVNRAHDAYARARGLQCVVCVPLRVGRQIRAVLSFERKSGEFEPAQLWEMVLVCELTAAHLSTLQQSDRWFGARLASWAGRQLGGVWGIDHSLPKLATLAIALCVLVSAFVPWPYRVDATATLRSEDIVFVPAPFDGFLREAHVKIGDSVQEGAATLTLDNREHLLDESMARAEVERFRREAEKAQAGGQLADMQIALARLAQSAARLDIVRYNLAHAQLRAPMSGVVVEGDLKQNIGAPVKKGDTLLKIARLDNTYLEIEVDPADVHEVDVGSRGEVAFVGRPDLRVPLVVERIEPMSTTQEGRNVFIARARLEGNARSWWRPGIGGTAKIDAGERSILRIATRRSVAFLQRVFWL
jgi:multidrug efflux pump subunit AcrA (membrane-fusion protein)